MKGCEAFMNKATELINGICNVVRGKDSVVKTAVITIIAGGHILMEDIPGVGKTTLAMTISKIMNLDYKRIQFTPDTLPGDITGFSMYNRKDESFKYVEGAVMTNILLADEINRTSAKTQSALLEAMEENNVTVDGVTRKLPEPFIVIATQNPFGSAGTQRLPQSQIERFMTKLSMGYPDVESEIDILKNDTKSKLQKIESVINSDELIAMKKQAEKCYVDDSVYKYIVDIVNATRNSRYIKLGVSPRGSVAVLKMAKARAVCENRDYVIPEDVKAIIYTTCCHRIELSNEALTKGYNEQQVLKSIIKEIRVDKK